MKISLTIFLILSAFVSRAQYAFDGAPDDDPLEKLILNYVENGIVEFKVKCKECPREVYKYELIEDSAIVESSGLDTVKFFVRNNQIKWIPSPKDVRDVDSRPRYFETYDVDSTNQKVNHRFKVEKGDTILLSTTYITEFEDSSKTERHIIPHFSRYKERKIITYAFSPDSTRRIIYDKVGESWEVNEDETSWVDTIQSANRLIIQKHEIRKSSITLDETPRMVESKNLMQHTFYYRNGLITKIKTLVTDINLKNGLEHTWGLTFKPRVIRRNRKR